MQTMGTNRIEAFSDGVIAIILTVMVLELKVPTGTTLSAVKAVIPTLLSYTLSFLIIAIMWVNHHHMMHLAKHANAKLLWANNNLLFWMSLIPFVTAYLGQTRGAPLAVAGYGLVLTFSAAGFTLVRWAVTAIILATLEPRNKTVARCARACGRVCSMPRPCRWRSFTSRCLSLFFS
jgi:uncharacterized membrane protein